MSSLQLNPTCTRKKVVTINNYENIKSLWRECQGDFWVNIIVTKLK